MMMFNGNGSSPWPPPVHPLPTRNRHWRAAAPVMLAILAACSDSPTAPRDEAGTTTVVRWNALAREFVIASRMAPPKAGRAYAYLSVGQYASALAARGARPDLFAPAAILDPQRGLTEAAVAAASAQLLGVMFPEQAARIAHELRAELAALRGRSAAPSAIESGQQLGEVIASSLATRAHADGADIVWSGTVPNGPGVWSGTNPQLPAWGSVRPWLWNSGEELKAPAPPAFDSETFRTALAEVRHIADTRTPAQLEIARFWADGAGTYTPPGHWNELAAGFISSSGMDEMHAARTMALVNIAMSDALIGCWATKFAYWVVRPYQADPAIATPIGQPPHPSYPSGHACSSSAGAQVLGAIFPASAEALEHLAVEACDSRVYAGIHYRFDAEAGMEIGQKAATRTIERGDAMVAAEIARALGTNPVIRNEITE